MTIVSKASPVTIRKVSNVFLDNFFNLCHPLLNKCKFTILTFQRLKLSNTFRPCLICFRLSFLSLFRSGWTFRWKIQKLVEGKVCNHKLEKVKLVATRWGVKYINSAVWQIAIFLSPACVFIPAIFMCRSAMSSLAM